MGLAEMVIVPITLEARCQATYQARPWHQLSRVAETDLEPVSQRRIVASNEALAALRDFGARAGITITL